MLSAYPRIVFISVLLLGNSTIVPQARAQDFNVETFVDQFAPPPKIEAPQPRVETVEETRFITVREKRKKTPEEADSEIQKFIASNPKQAAAEIGAAISKLEEEGSIPPQPVQLFSKSAQDQYSVVKLEDNTVSLKLLGALGKSETKYVPVRKPITEKRTIVTPPKPTLIAAIGTTYGFDSNIFNRKTDVISDQYFSTNPALTLSVPTSSSSGFAFTISSTFLRFNEQSTRDRDILVGGAGFASKISSKTLDERSQTKQEEQVSISIVSQNVYEPGFAGPGTHIYSPAIGWKLAGIPLSRALCGKQGARVNCYVGGVTLELGRTWIGNVGAQKNTRFKIGASFDWQIRGLELVWGVSGAVTDRYYEDFPDGRNDVFFQTATTLTWKPSSSITLVAKASYSNQASSQSPLDYEDYVLLPSMTGKIAF